MTDISVVSGTYNRLPSLQRMIESARIAKGEILGLSLSFTLVDGGSTDGTIEWCKTQPDIYLIEHGKLLGAVKAFNDGAFAAEATYIILANDDIEFVEGSILLAYLYMQAHSDCGIGCFYQDRERQHLPDSDVGKWHVQHMPVVEGGKQSYGPYGQVCIVPKWLGDSVGWWGDYLHTYGGDNELSSKVYELGYKVSPIVFNGRQARISDHELQDDLRKVNNFGHNADPKKTLGHHPDSYAWGRKWKHFNLPNAPVGPIVRHIPMVDNPIQPKPRVMYLPIFEQGWTVQKEQKRGLREALVNVGLVTEFDYIQANAEWGKAAMIIQLEKLMFDLQPTIFLSQIHNGAILNGDDITLLQHNWPNTLFVNWNGDYWPENLLTQDGLNLARAFDWQLGVNRDAIEKQKQAGVNAAYWQIGFEPDGVGYESDLVCDVVFLASGYSKARQSLVTNLRQLDVSFHLYGSGWPQGWSKGQSMYDFKSACQQYRSGRISIGDSQWPETGFVSNRVFQALAAGGSALAHQWFKDMDRLGLIDGETCIIWRNFGELRDKIEYYLNHEDERKRIAAAGERLALEHHSFDVRVKELFEIIGQTKPVAEDSWRW